MSICFYITFLKRSTQFLTDFHTQKKRPEAPGTNPMPRPLPALNLRVDFCPIAEGEYHPAVRIDRCVIHKPVEQLLVEIHRQFFHFAKPRKEAAEKVPGDKWQSIPVSP